jgi:DNA/RNA endonuclease YhcR with UshA esterase domain
MRPAFIFVLLTLTVLLHICTWKLSSATRSSAELQNQIFAEVSDPVRIAHISASGQGERITVVGQVSDIWESAGKRAPHTIILRDGTGALEIVHWLKQSPRVGVGDSVECTGTIDLYRGGLQLRLWSPADLQVLGHKEYVRNGSPAPSRQ